MALAAAYDEGHGRQTSSLATPVVRDHLLSFCRPCAFSIRIGYRSVVCIEVGALMRYRLRTLMILLAVLPPLLWLGWTKYEAWRAERELRRARLEWVLFHGMRTP